MAKSKVNQKPSSQIGGGAHYAGGGGFMAQMEVPQYALEGEVDVSPQKRDARREGFSSRTTSKIGLLGKKTNAAIDSMNTSKLDHLAMVTSVNKQVGAPDAGAYKGFTEGSVNQAIAYAMDKKKKSAEKHWANAEAAANSVKASAEAQGAALQKKFDAAGGQANQANRLNSIIAHLAKREVGNAQAQQTAQQTQGLINSDSQTSVLANLSPMSDNSIGAMLKQQGQA